MLCLHINSDYLCIKGTEKHLSGYLPEGNLLEQLLSHLLVFPKLAYIPLALEGLENMYGESLALMMLV